ncbi:substance-K receptor-like [Oppia nitens]|uniref:substance-K receptor-like n=1 Tax=Oppia nitens TaxID=1686743 RepID=UPI0023DAEA7C|nr:substance-K receptor-like [Oppia nitens]
MDVMRTTATSLQVITTTTITNTEINDTLISGDNNSGDEYYLKDNQTFNEVEEFDLYQVPTELAIFLSICYCCVSLCAVIGNSMIIWIVLRSVRMRSVTNYFIANLAFADILIGAFAIPFQFQAALLQRWDLPYFMCSFCPTVQVVSVNVSVFTLTAIALDRYRAVLHPLQARTTKLKTKFIIITIWLFSIFASIPTLIAFNVELTWDETTQDYTLPFCHNTGLSAQVFRYYNHTLVALQYLIPLVIISYAYLRMCVHLYLDDEAPANSRVDATHVNRNKKRVIKMLFIVVALFGICWLPYQLYNILQEIYIEINKYRYINIIWFFCHFLAMSNSCYNPFIYAIYSERFNAEFRHRSGCCCWCQCCRQIGPHRTNNGNTIVVTTTTDVEHSQWLTHSHISPQLNHFDSSHQPESLENHHKKSTLVRIPRIPTNNSNIGLTVHQMLAINTQINSMNTGV